MRIRIQSDGTSRGTQICDESGNILENVISIEYISQIGRNPLAIVTFAHPIINIDEVDAVLHEKHYAHSRELY